MANDKRGQQLHDAIARRDAATLWRMSASQETEEGRTWLALLARMVELDARRRPPITRVPNLVPCSSSRRVSLRRAI